MAKPKTLEEIGNTFDVNNVDQLVWLLGELAMRNVRQFRWRRAGADAAERESIRFSPGSRSNGDE